MTTVAFEKPAFYFPIERQLYEVAPNLKPFGFDFGNGSCDQRVFQIDENFNSYRENKLACRKERLNKYFLTHNFSTLHEKALSEFVIEQLLKDYPQFFKVTPASNHSNNDLYILQCLHTGDQITYSKASMHLQQFQTALSEPSKLTPAPEHLIDALSLQVAEDVCLLIRRTPEQHDIGLLHLCSPSHWAAEDKIGRTFAEVHAPIPHIEKINKASLNMVEAMINKGPFVRFVWSFVTDTRLNHHPVAPAGFDAVNWKGRSFNPDAETPFYLRIERQVVYGLPHIDSSFFGIGITFIEAQKIKADPNMNQQLLGALNSMSDESKAYKGVLHCFSELISYLSS